MLGGRANRQSSKGGGRWWQTATIAASSSMVDTVEPTCFDLIGASFTVSRPRHLATVLTSIPKVRGMPRSKGSTLYQRSDGVRDPGAAMKHLSDNASL